MQHELVLSYLPSVWLATIELKVSPSIRSLYIHCCTRMATVVLFLVCNFTIQPLRAATSKKILRDVEHPKATHVVGGDSQSFLFAFRSNPYSSWVIFHCDCNHYDTRRTWRGYKLKLLFDTTPGGTFCTCRSSL